jgi:hypothetical protein
MIEPVHINYDVSLKPKKLNFKFHSILNLFILSWQINHANYQSYNIVSIYLSKIDEYVLLCKFLEMITFEPKTSDLHIKLDSFGEEKITCSVCLCNCKPALLGIWTLQFTYKQKQCLNIWAPRISNALTQNKRFQKNQVRASPRIFLNYKRFLD